MEILGQKLDDKQVKGLIKEVDKSNSGKLDFAKFCKLAARFVEVEEDGPVLMGELKEAFRVYDREGKGYLTVQVLRTILKELDDKLSNQDLDMIIDEIDADGSGTVDFDGKCKVKNRVFFFNFLLFFKFLPYRIRASDDR